VREFLQRRRQRNKKESSLKFGKAVGGFLKQAREHLTGSLTTGSPDVDSATRLDSPPSDAGVADARHNARQSERRNGNRRPEHALRRGADTRIHLARAKKPGDYRAYTRDGDKVIFRVWASPDGKVCILHPKVCWREGVEVARFDGKGPSLPMKVLSGKDADSARFPKAHRDALELFTGVLVSAAKDDMARQKERRETRRTRSAT